MTRLLFALSLFLAMGDLAKAQTTRPGPDPRKQLCTVSAIGESFTLKRIGIMVFGNEQNKVAIPDWKIDERVNALIAQLVPKKFQVKRLPLPSGGFTSLYKEGNRDYRDDIGSVLRQIAGTANCDYILLVYSGGSQYASSNQFLGGLGVVQVPSLGDVTRFVHALPLLLVYDGRSFQILREERHLAIETLFDPIHGPHKRLTGPFTENMSDMLKDRTVRETTWALLEADLVKTVPKLFAAN